MQDGFPFFDCSSFRSRRLDGVGCGLVFWLSCTRRLVEGFGCGEKKLKRHMVFVFYFYLIQLSRFLVFLLV